jgi:hypothetical protein
VEAVWLVIDEDGAEIEFFREKEDAELWLEGSNGCAVEESTLAEATCWHDIPADAHCPRCEAELLEAWAEQEAEAAAERRWERDRR